MKAYCLIGFLWRHATDRSKKTCIKAEKSNLRKALSNYLKVPFFFFWKTWLSLCTIYMMLSNHVLAFAAFALVSTTVFVNVYWSFTSDTSSYFSYSNVHLYFAFHLLLLVWVSESISGICWYLTSISCHLKYLGWCCSFHFIMIRVITSIEWKNLQK